MLITRISDVYIFFNITQTLERYYRTIARLYREIKHYANIVGKNCRIFLFNVHSVRDKPVSHNREDGIPYASLCYFYSIAIFIRQEEIIEQIIEQILVQSRRK